MMGLDINWMFHKNFVQTSCAVFVVLFFVQYCYPQSPAFAWIYLAPDCSIAKIEQCAL